jgi:hypothetical protein
MATPPNDRPQTVSSGVIRTKASALIRAAALFGGIDELSTYLCVSPGDLRRWMAGDGEPPYSKFILVVDAILDE